MKLSWFNALASVFLAATLSVPSWGAAKTAVPGTLNYIEGQASLGSQQLSTSAVGSTVLQPGQTLATQSGRVEVLLTPGVFLRLDDNSAVKMVSPSLTNTQVEVQKGSALVEVNDIHKQNNIQVRQDDVSTRLLKNGLYGFSAADDTVRVFKGQAKVQDDEKTIKINSGHELALNSPKLKTASFKEKNATDSFYDWSSLRSEYLAEANENAAMIYAGNAWGGPGWYWDPWFSAYTFIPGSGILYSPFGWGFYSPASLGYAPFFYGGFYGGYPYHYRPFLHGPHDFRPGVGVPHPLRPPLGVPRAGISHFGAFHGMPHMGGFGGGFHGGMGGFHGGGFHGGGPR